MRLIQHTTLRELLLKTKERLVSKNILPANAIFISNKMWPEPVTLDRFIQIVPLQVRRSSVLETDAGRYYTCVEALVDIYVYNRLNLDQMNRDDQWLTHQTLGTLEILEKCISALHRWLNIELMTTNTEFAMIGEPRRYTRLENRQFGFVFATFIYQYALLLDPQEDPHPGLIEGLNV
jgi:hypothetical protein